MQGANHATENKWNLCVENMFQQLNLNVCTLQECGARPASTTPVAPGPGVPALPPGCELYRWGGTRIRGGRFILFWPNNDAVRLGLAVVSDAMPSACFLVNSANPPQVRPALGIHYAGAPGPASVFSIHSISPGGADAPGLVQASFAAGGVPTIVAGDFNREPLGLGNAPLPAGSVICPPNLFTHSTQQPTTMLDYAITYFGPAVTGLRQDLIFSDHYPVAFKY